MGLSSSIGDGSLAAGSHDDTNARRFVATIGNRDSNAWMPSLLDVAIQYLLFDRVPAVTKYTERVRVHFQGNEKLIVFCLSVITPHPFCWRSIIHLDVPSFEDSSSNSVCTVNPKTISFNPWVSGCSIVETSTTGVVWPVCWRSSTALGFQRDILPSPLKKLKKLQRS